MSKSRGAYPSEFRRQMVELVIAGRTPEELAGSSSRRRSRSGTGFPSRGMTRAEAMAVLTSSEREELNRLRRENRQLPAGAGDPVKGGGLVRSGDERDPSAGFRFVSDHQADYPIATMCRLLGVSSSGYHAWVKRQPSGRSETDAALTADIRTAHAASRGTYGAPRIHAELAAKGARVGRKRVARLMRQAGVAGVSRRKFVTTTVKGNRRQAPDLVERNFSADAPDRLWVADITYIPTWTGFLYLAVVLDAYSRRIVGWSMATTLATQLVLDALDMALLTRRPQGVIHHSDQGSQYTSIEFGQRCRDAGVRPSMGSVGDAYDNAMCESFFATSSANSSHGAGSGHRPRREAPCSASSRGSTIRAVAIPQSAISRRSTSSGGIRQRASLPAHTSLPPVLAAVKDEPFGRPQEAAVLDRRCARRPHHRAGRDGRMAPPGAEPKNVSTQEGSMPSNHTA